MIVEDNPFELARPVEEEMKSSLVDSDDSSQNENI